jgi:hypothetical protein
MIFCKVELTHQRGEILIVLLNSTISSQYILQKMTFLKVPKGENNLFVLFRLLISYKNKFRSVLITSGDFNESISII